MPVRKGDGTEISSIRLGDGTGIAEVRTGDGRVLFSAKAGGARFYIIENNTDSVYQYDTSTAFDISTGSVAGSFDISSEEGLSQGLWFNNDGSLLYIAGLGSETIYQYTLSTAFDISTASLDTSFDVSAQGRPRGGAWSTDGSVFFFPGDITANVYQYTASTAFDISSLSFDQSFDVSGQDGTPTGIGYNTDGTQLYLTGKDNADVYEYALSTAFDISTASFTQSFDVSGQDTTPEGVTFRPSGESMYLAGADSDALYQYTLSTAFDISTASLDTSFDVSAQDTPRDVAWDTAPQF